MTSDLAVVLLGVAIQIAGAVVFAIVLRHFDHEDGRAHVRFWIWSWLAFIVYAAAGLAGRLLTPAWPVTSAPRAVLSVVSLTAAMLQLIWLLQGAREFLARRRFPQAWVAPAAGIALAIALVLTFAWIGDPAAASRRYFARVGVRGLLAGASFLLAGLWFARHSRAPRSIGRALLPAALGLYGVDQVALVTLGLPMGRPLGSIDPLRFILGYGDVFLQLLIGLGMLFWLLERERRDRQDDWQRMAESEERYRTLAESATDAIISIDESSKIVFANSATVRTFGYQTGELIGAPLTTLMPDASQPRHLAALASYYRTNERRLSWTAVSLMGRHKTGRDVPLEMSLTENVRGGQRFFTGIIRDVSDRLRLEDELRQSQKMEAIGRLAGGIAHDFNNLITAIGGNADLTLADLGPDDPVRPRIVELRRAAQRAADLTGQLLTFSRRRRIQPGPLDLNVLVGEIGEMLGRLIGEHITLDLVRPEHAVYAHADSSLIYQVLLNLAVNARDSMPSGGRLAIEASEVVLDPAAASRDPRRRAGSFACLTVTDRGCGIEAKDLPHIFEPFFTTKEVGKGTGLGLATTYAVVQQHQGWIEVVSEVGVGSTFRVFLPKTS